MISERDVKKLTAEVATLKQEVGRLRSVLISIVGEDREGEYRAEIIKELLEAAGEQPKYDYTGRGSLIANLRNLR